MERKYFEIAKQYRDNGLCVIPLRDFNFNISPEKSKRENKMPAIKWSEITELPTDIQLCEWFIEGGYTQMAIICGRISGVTIIDKDYVSGQQLPLPEIFSPIITITSSGGEQHWFKYTNQVATANLHTSHNLPIDILNDGKIALVAPDIGWVSKKENIVRYRWGGEPFNRSLLPEFPKEMIEIVNKGKIFSFGGEINPIPWNQELGKGSRNSEMSRIMASILKDIPVHHWADKGYPICKAYAEKYCKQIPDDPYSEDEFEKSFKSACDFIARNNPKKLEPPITHNPLKLKDILLMEEEKFPWILDKIIREKAINSLTSTTGQGKSLLMNLLVEAIINGGKLFDEFETKKTNILIIDGEMDKNEIISRCKTIFYETPIENQNSLFILMEEEWKLNAENDVLWTENFIRENNIGLLVLDTFSTSHDKNENSAQEMGEINAVMKNLIDKTGVTILYLHHNRKPQEKEEISNISVRGSGDIVAKVSVNMQIIKSVKSKQNKNDKIVEVLTITLKQSKARSYGNVDPMEISIWQNEDGKTKWEKNKITEGMAKQAIAEQWIMDILTENEEMAQSSLEEMRIQLNLDFGTNALRDAITSLKSQSKIFYRRGLRNAKYWTLNNPSCQSSILDN